MAGFELATPCTPCKCATRLRYAPTEPAIIHGPPWPLACAAHQTVSRSRIDISSARNGPGSSGRDSARVAIGSPADSGAAAASSRASGHPRRSGCRARRGGVRQAVARAADREALVVQQFADAPDQQHLVVLVVAPVATALHRLELRELLLPVAQHVRLDPAQLAHLTDGEVALGGDGGERFLH